MFTFAVILLCAAQEVAVGAAPVSPTTLIRPSTGGLRPIPVATGRWQPTSTRARPNARTARSIRTLSAGATLLSENFTGSATTPNAWLGLGGACLTAGSSTTPVTSIAASGAQAPVDAAGAGALQLTNATTNQLGMIVTKNALSTANGLQVTFNDYAFSGTNRHIS